MVWVDICSTIAEWLCPWYANRCSLYVIAFRRTEFMVPAALTCVGAASSLVQSSNLAAGVGLVDSRQCVTPLLLLVSVSMVLGSLLLKSIRAVRLVGKPLQVQMTKGTWQSVLPLVMAVAFQVAVCIVVSLTDPWQARYLPDSQGSSVQCSCQRTTVAVLLFGVNIGGRLLHAPSM